MPPPESSTRAAARLRVTPGRVVALAALVALGLRFPGVLWPVLPDEAGFTLVARAWDPEPDSVYGQHFVDRPPLIIALVKLCDAIGGPLVLRVLAGLGCALAVVAAAGVARRVAPARRWAPAWTAVATAAVCANTMIDPVSAKGEILGIPVILTSMWWSLLALERRSSAWAAGAGLMATVALGLKQNLVAGLVFGAVLLLTAAALRRLPRADAVRLGVAATAGAAVPLLAQVGWAVLAGVRLETLWYTVYGFRGDATDVLVTGRGDAPVERAVTLAGIMLACGIVLIIGGFLAHVRGEWAANPPVAAATVMVILVDGAGLVLSGSYWTAYAFALVPATALSAAMLVRRRSKRGLAMRAAIVAAAISTVGSVLGWVTTVSTGAEKPTEVWTGEAIAAAARPGDTLVVFGGRADIQYASGLRSPYEQLWSLPMRTLDPGYRALAALVASRDRPTWITEAVSFTAWRGPAGEDLEALVEGLYRVGGFSCHGDPIWVRSDVERPWVLPDCDRTVL